MSKPTHDDARLMVELAHLYAVQDVGEAAGWIRSDAFISDYAQFNATYPQGSVEALKLGKVLNYYETLGTLHKHDLINEDLLFDWLAINIVWDRVKGVVQGIQAATSPAMYENFEAMAKAEARWSATLAKRSR